MAQFLKDHFDHLLLTLLAMLGTIGALVSTAHGWHDATNWLFSAAGSCLGALVMRMQPRKDTPPPVDKSAAPNVQ